MSIFLRFNALLDANVLYPAPIRDILLNLAEQELYSPKWSKTIEVEWTRNLLKNRPDLTMTKLERTVRAMNRAFPNARVRSYQKLIDELELPDPDDRHVLAAAIKSESKAVITFNKKDFQSKKIEKEYNISILAPDQFICRLSEMDVELTKQAFSNQLASLKNPPISKKRLLEILQKCGLKKSLEIFS
ncbi:MAG: PIN domain-containing protein [Bacteroidota bacterium]